MKKSVLFPLVILLLAACGNEVHNDSPPTLFGKWQIEYYIQHAEKHIFGEPEYVIIFLENGYVKQFPDFPASGVPYTITGDTLEWHTNGERGMINFKYQYSFKADTLLLENLTAHAPFIEGISCYSRQ